MNNSAIIQTRKTTTRAQDFQQQMDKNTSSCLVMDGNLSLLGEPLSAKIASMTPCQESLLAEYLNVTSQHRRETQAIMARLTADTKGLAERKILDKKAIERDLARRFDDIESAVQDSIRVVNQRLAAIENIEYEIKYKQAR